MMKLHSRIRDKYSPLLSRVCFVAEETDNENIHFIDQVNASELLTQTRISTVDEDKEEPSLFFNITGSSFEHTVKGDTTEGIENAYDAMAINFTECESVECSSTSSTDKSDSVNEDSETAMSSSGVRFSIEECPQKEEMVLQDRSVMNSSDSSIEKICNTAHASVTSDDSDGVSIIHTKEISNAEASHYRMIKRNQLSSDSMSKKVRRTRRLQLDNSRTVGNKPE